MNKKSSLSTESYKGVRDFYPEDLSVLKHIFSVWQNTVESFGYVEYSASLLEPAELYRAKTGEEIVNNETYTFADRSEREVTLRPEMTPTVARMVAARERELAFPLRWYSIPNLFRYEKPQRGRLREHWQLNVDIFGAESLDADIELMAIAHRIMKNFGAGDDDFVLKINSRRLMNDLYSHFKLSEEESQKISKIIDKKAKISSGIFESSIEEIIGARAKDFIRALSSNEHVFDTLGKDCASAQEIADAIEKLAARSITNVQFDQTLMRGFDYYTGIVFEVFDTNPENPRSVFGGGRYDDLLDIFGARKVPAAGFGAGDVTARDFLETHGLLPKYISTTDLYICVMKPEYAESASKLADTLRENDVCVALDITGKKVGDQVKIAHRQSIPYVLVVGEDEIKSGEYSLKNMETGEEKKVKAENIRDIVKNR